MDLYEICIYLSLYVWGLFLIINLAGFYLLKKKYYPKLAHRKVFKLETTQKQHKFEFKHALISTFIFMLTFQLAAILYQKGYTPVHHDLDQWGVGYAILSYFLIHTYHDAYFYWTHRALHEVKWLKKFHVVHHTSRVPTPIAASSFSVVEALIQAGFYITAVYLIPAHWSIHLFFYFFISWIAMWGHVEFEFWPSALYRLPYGSTFNSLTHHNLHHYYGKGNYGLYYRFWDELCGTLHPKTYQYFYEVQQRIGEKKRH